MKSFVPMCAKDFFMLVDVNLDGECRLLGKIKPFIVFVFQKAWTPTPPIFGLFRHIILFVLSIYIHTIHK